MKNSSKFLIFLLVVSIIVYICSYTPKALQEIDKSNKILKAQIFHYDKTTYKYLLVKELTNQKLLDQFLSDVKTRDRLSGRKKWLDLYNISVKLENGKIIEFAFQVEPDFACVYCISVNYISDQSIFGNVLSDFSSGAIGAWLKVVMSET